ncbi:MAG: hypothetical protein IKY44_04235 [Clostridia bacterium]|nr:hypothetical protein [Clostridia bacterium]
MNTTHLTIDEMIEFVSFSAITEETLTLSAKVNGHIRGCAECQKRVGAFQDVYDELCRIGGAATAKSVIYRVVSEQELEAICAKQFKEAFENIEDMEAQGLI